MKRKTPLPLYISAAIFSFVFVGCTHQQPSPSNTNTTNQSNTNLNQQVNVNTNTTANTNTNTNPDQEVDTSDWLTYANEEYGFSFKYPEDWVVMTSYDYENDKPILDETKKRYYVLDKEIAWKKQEVLGVLIDADHESAIQYDTDSGVEVNEVTIDDFVAQHVYKPEGYPTEDFYIQDKKILFSIYTEGDLYDINSAIIQSIELQ